MPDTPSTPAAHSTGEGGGSKDPPVTPRPVPRTPAPRSSVGTKAKYDPQKLEYELRYCEVTSKCVISVVCSLVADLFVLLVDLEEQTIQLRVRLYGACTGPPGRVIQSNDPMSRLAREGFQERTTCPSHPSHPSHPAHDGV